MLENAHQDFLSGSQPPFGYAASVQERRGTKDKKVLVIRDDEARVICFLGIEVDDAIEIAEKIDI